MRVEGPRFYCDCGVELKDGNFIVRGGELFCRKCGEKPLEMACYYTPSCPRTDLCEHGKPHAFEDDCKRAIRCFD